MRDPAPLSQRFDLRYVRQRWWPWRWTLRLSAVLILAAIGWAGVTIGTGDERAFTSGAVTHAHSFIANDCAACHQPDPQRSGYWLPAADAACIQCHLVAAHPDPAPGSAFTPHGLPAGHPVVGKAGSGDERMSPVMVSSGCADCHIEHQGVDHDLSRVDDRYCTQCHGDLDAYMQRSTATFRMPGPTSASPRDIREFGGFGEFRGFRELAAAGEVSP